MKLTHLVRTGAVLGVMLALQSTSAADAPLDLGKLPPPAAKTGITYAKDIQPLIEKSCLKCHSGRRPKARYDMTTLEGVLKGGSEGVAVVPGKSAESRMIHFAADLVVEFEMPPMDMREEFPALTKEQIGLLRAWIDQGAK